MVAFLARRRQVVEQADPHEVARAFGKAEDRRIRRHRSEPRPAGGERKCTGEQALCRLPCRFAEPPNHDRGKPGRRERMAPEGDQRVHPPPSVKSADMRRGVAKLYKELMNA